MGLPSGVQWASCNIGAERPGEYGLYFSWGNVEGHNEGEGYNFTQEVYNSTPAAAIATDLSLEQDAARVYLGAPWRMPSAADFMELYDNCTCIWASYHGVNGYLFTSNLNGNSIFFPAAGYYGGSSLNNRGLSGLYWSSTYISATNARLMSFVSSAVNPQKDDARRFGFSVRAVMQSL